MKTRSPLTRWGSFFSWHKLECLKHWVALTSTCLKEPAREGSQQSPSLFNSFYLISLSISGREKGIPQMGGTCRGHPLSYVVTLTDLLTTFLISVTETWKELEEHWLLWQRPSGSLPSQQLFFFCRLGFELPSVWKGFVTKVVTISDFEGC